MENEKQETNGSEINISTEEIKKGKESKYEKVKTITEIAQNVAVILTFCAAVFAFIFSGFRYIYELGYCNAIGVDSKYIDISNQESSYEIIICCIIALLLLVSNVYSYLLMKSEKSAGKYVNALLFIGEALIISMLVFQFCEIGKVMIAVVVFICISMNIYVVWWIIIRVIRFIIRIVRSWIISMLANIKIDMKFTDHMQDYKIDEKKEYDDKKKNEDKIITVIHYILFIMFLTIGEVIIIYKTGMDKSNEQREYRIVISEDLHNTNEDFIFSMYGKDANIYLVLYENSDSYIVSYLCRNDKGKIEKDNERKKVIPKEGMELEYVKDFSSLDRDEDKNH